MVRWAVKKCGVNCVTKLTKLQLQQHQKHFICKYIHFHTLGLLIKVSCRWRQRVLSELQDNLSTQVLSTNQDLTPNPPHGQLCRQHLSSQIILERLHLHEQIQSHLNRFLL